MPNYDVKFLRGTNAGYAALETKDSKTFYATEDSVYLGSIKLSAAGDIASAVARIAKNEEDITSIFTSLQTITGEGEGSISKAVGDARTALEALIDAVDDKADANATAINAINDANTGILKQAKDYADGKDAAIAAAKKSGDDAQADVDALEEKIGTVPADSTVMAEIEKAQEAATYDDTAIKTRITANENAITTINGNDTVAGSTDKKIKDAINAFATEITEDGTINTFKEVLDYIAEHGSDFTALVGRVTTAEGKITTAEGNITTNANAIDDLEDLVGTIPQGATADTLVGYVQELVTAEQNRATGVEGDLDSRLDTVEELVGEGGSVDEKIATAKSEAIAAASTDATTKANTAEQNAKDYADSLAGDYDVAGSAASAETAAKSYTDTALTWGTF